MGKSDRRVQYTKRVLREAVQELLKIKSIDEVTIKEVCELADINRGTFYLHYTQPRDILKEIENSFIQENMATFDDYWENQRDMGMMAKIFTCIVENKELCRILMGENGDPQFLRSLENLARTAILDEWQKEFPMHKREHLDFLYDYVFTGSMRLILKWIDEEQNLSAAAFAHRLERLGHYCLVAVGEFDPEGENKRKALPKNRGTA